VYLQTSKRQRVAAREPPEFVSLLRVLWTVVAVGVDFPHQELLLVKRATEAPEAVVVVDLFTPVTPRLVVMAALAAVVEPLEPACNPVAERVTAVGSVVAAALGQTALQLLLVAADTVAGVADAASRLLVIELLAPVALAWLFYSGLKGTDHEIRMD
jgi:hypothetical protein